MRTLRTILSVALIASALAAVQITSVSAGQTCNSDIKTQLVNRIGGQCSDWTLIRDGFGNYVGATFDSGSDDTRLRAPRKGRLDTACGRIWSTQDVTRRIVVTLATYWRSGGHTSLTNCALTPAMAAKKYRTGDGTAQYWHLKGGSQNTGWIWDSPSAAQIFAYHGHVDHPSGTTGTGHWTPAVTDATGWYWNS